MIVLEAICRGLHVLGAVCWIGALYFLIRAVRPILLNGKHPEISYALLREIQKKFRVLVVMMLSTVVVTGFGNLFFVFYNGSIHGISWMILITLKLILVVILVIIFFLNIYASDEQKARVQKNPGNPPEKPVFVLPKIALVTGLVIVFLGVLLHTSLVK